MVVTPSPTPIPIGLNYRDFPGNWRAAREEIAFARAHSFGGIQFHGREAGLSEDDIGGTFAEVGAALRAAALAPTMEIMARVDTDGRTGAGQTPLDLLRANLPAILALGCACVHWHLVPIGEANPTAWSALERALVPQLVTEAELGAAHGFRCGIEHNEPAVPLFPTPERCAAALAAVPGLGFVWDCNHTAPEQRAGYLALTGRMTMLHVADTPLPATNHHLPLGLGAIDFADTFRELRARAFVGPAILEIGGLPISGGYGRDTDEVLIASRQLLTEVLITTTAAP
jgi:L-ribulose-5-phosphate 3-epimerase